MTEEKPPSATKPTAKRRITWVALGVAGAIILIAWLYTQHWSGFGSTQLPKDNRAKTLWDWMELLIVPTILAGGAFWLNESARAREHLQTERQKETDRDASAARAAIDRAAAEERAALDRELAADQLHETSLQSYLDQMSELMLTRTLLQSSQDDEVRGLARIRTLTALRRLDPARSAIVIGFLHDAKLLAPLSRGFLLKPEDFVGINLHGATLYRLDLKEINLSLANLRGAILMELNLQSAILVQCDMSHANLRFSQLDNAFLTNANLTRASMLRVNLSGATMTDVDASGAFMFAADLGGAKLSGAILKDTDLTQANLAGADLYGANLSGAKLIEANLTKADLSSADLTSANLANADLAEANLAGAKVTPEQLAHVRSLRGATLQDGSLHD
jgi:uncharacterized protein YjbI with pentapeptide repeats